MFLPGSIRRIEVKNFVTYSHAELYPGPNLNMIIGPNGTGKSTMVAAIILGLGGNPKVVGRGTKIAEYVKHGCTEAKIDIYLQGGQENEFLKVTRQFTNQDRNSWSINGTKSCLKDVEEITRPYNIQVNNLCQFLPQDRVQDFAKMNKQELLKATQRAVCREDLSEKQEKLIENRSKHEDLSKFIESNQRKLIEAQESNARLEGKIQSFNKKRKYLNQIQQIDRKCAWIQYEKLREALDQVKSDKVEATKMYEKYKEAAKPMEQQIGNAKKDVLNLQKVHSNIVKTIRETERTLNNKNEQLASFKQSIQNVKQEMNIKLDEIAERHNEIETNLKNIESLKEAQQKLMNKCGNDEKILQKVKQITAQIEQVNQNTRGVEDKKEELMTQKQHSQSELRMIENEISRLENIKLQRLQKLSQIDKHAYDAVLWLRNNKHLFRGEVCEPMILEVNVLDPKNAIYLENVISRRDRLAFTCERKDDMNLLIQHLRIKQKLSVNVLHSSAEIDMSRYQPMIPIEQLRQYGLHAYLHSLFTAPDLIMNYLYRNYGVHNIPVGNDKVNQYFEKVPNQFSVFFSDKCRFAVKFSKYTGAKTTRQNQISPNHTLSISLDVIKLENLKSKIQEKKANSANIDNALRNYHDQLEQSNARIQELQSELKVIKELKQQIKTIGSRCETMKKNVECLKAANTNRDDVIHKANEKIKKIAKEVVAHQNVIISTQKSYKKLVIKSKVNFEKTDLQRRRIANLENEFEEIRRKCEEAEEILNQAKEKYAAALGQAKAALQKAKNASNGFTPDQPGFEEFREMYEKLSEDLQTLLQDKEQILSKIYCLKVANDGELQEYEDRVSLIENLEKQLDQANEEAHRMIAKIDKLEEEWLIPLGNLVMEINRRFSDAFKRMDCAGEVAVWTGENPKDYSQYGLSIKVTYRNGEPLQELNGTIQSGGERAVATAAFMLSLQELTPVPFRCVDEINQGMDANNERRIFDLLVDCTTQANTAQYFFITPKLVPNLRYSKNMLVHIVHNGPFVTPDRKWYLSKFCNPQGVRIAK